MKPRAGWWPLAFAAWVVGACGLVAQAQSPARPEPGAADRLDTAARQQGTKGRPQGVPPQRPTTAQPSRHGRLFPPVDLGLLEGPDRDTWQKSDRIMDALGVADGSRVADVGAGAGWFTIRLARRVGPNGTVYAEDVQPEMIQAIARRVGREGLRNVRTVLGTAENPTLPNSDLDAILIVGTYHEMEDPVRLLTNATKALKAQGRIGIVDFTKNGGGPGPPIEERVDPEAIIRDARAAGLWLIGRETFLPYQFFLVFGK